MDLQTQKTNKVLSWAPDTLAAWPVSKAIGALMVNLMFNVGLH